MKILIYGAGAIGSYLGALLQLSGHEVGLIGRSAHVQAIKKHGLVLEDKITEKMLNIHFSIVSTSLEEMLDWTSDLDWIIITTKAWANETVSIELQRYQKFFGGIRDQKPPYLCVFQNGMGNERYFLERLGLSFVFRGVTAHGCIFKEPGHVIHVGEGFTKLGLVPKHLLAEDDATTSPFIQDVQYLNLVREGQLLCQKLNEAGLNCEWTDDLLPVLYLKLAVNCVINILTGAFQVTNGSLLADKNIKPLFDQVLTEVSSFVHELCPSLSVTQIVETVIEVVKKTASNYSSLLQDLLLQRKTEIDYLCGYLLQQARRKRKQLPHLETLMMLIKYKEEMNVKGSRIA